MKVAVWQTAVTGRALIDEWRQKFNDNGGHRKYLDKISARRKTPEGKAKASAKDKARYQRHRVARSAAAKAAYRNNREAKLKYANDWYWQKIKAAKAEKKRQQH